MTDLASWYAYVIRYEAREFWRALPGPWPVKVLTLAVLAAIPGEIDEFLFVLVVGALRKRRARRAAQIRA